MKLIGYVCVGILGLGLVWAARVGPGQEGLTVHEWGTFTSVAGVTGESVDWQPLVEPPDLPCFVNRLSLQNIKVMPARVRMETPVIYFYAPREMPVSVRVRFPEGMITEWYPRATRVEPSVTMPQFGMSMEWNADVQPETQHAFPMESKPSRYYAARETDAAPLRIGGQQEKLIFYRGIGNFAAPVRARFSGEGTLALSNSRTDAIPAAIVFMNRGGKIGWREVSPLVEAAVDTGSLGGDMEGLRAAMEEILTAQGLYAKEASAMLETWRDSWFEEGTRVLYIVPRTMVDRVLPLTVNPAPAALARVFVGRVEVLAPWMDKEISAAVASDQPATVEKYGRFLQPFLRRQRMGPRMSGFINAQYQRVFARLAPAGCAQ